MVAGSIILIIEYLVCNNFEVGSTCQSNIHINAVFIILYTLALIILFFLLLHGLVQELAVGMFGGAQGSAWSL